MPDHWRLDNLPGPPWLAAILRLQFIGLCLISFGYADLETVWEISTADEATWTAHKGVIADRISTITVVVSLPRTPSVCEPENNIHPLYRQACFWVRPRHS